MSPPIPPTPAFYRTTDFYLACYLVFLKVPLEAVEPLSAARVVFVFKTVPDQVVLDYYNHTPQTMAFIDAVEAIRHTRELLHHALDRKR